MGLPIFRFTLKHLLTANDIQFTNNSFATSLTGWDQITGGDISFTWNNPSSARAAGAGANTAAIGQICKVNSTAGWPAGTYTIQVKATNLSTGGSSPFASGMVVYGSDTGAALDDVMTYTGDGTWNVGAGPITNEVTFTTTQAYQKLFFKFIKQGPSSGYNVNITIDFIELIRVQNATNDLQISEPDGWKEAKLKLERHPDFHSLVEYFEGGFIYYGENNVDIGGADFIRSTESLYGYNADIIEEIDVSFDSSVYENIFTGLLDLTTLQEVRDNKIEAATIPDNLWSKFISRLDTPVDLRSTTDLDGNPISPVEPIDINLPSQKVRQVYSADYTDDDNIDGVRQYVIPAGEYGIIDFESPILDEIKEKFNYLNTNDPEVPFEMFSMEYAGSYAFNVQLSASTTPLGVLGSSLTDIVVRFQINNDTPINFTKTNGGTNGINGNSVYTYNAVHQLKVSDQIRIYYENTGGVSRTFYTSGKTFSFIRVTADTTYESTDAKGFYLHDVFAGIVNRIVGSNVFYSDVLGRTDTNMRAYGSNGCYSGFALLKGLQIRGYLLEDKIFSISFNQAWKGADPIFNLGLRRDNNGDFIRIERKNAEYDPTSVSVSIENVRTISREYDTSRIIGTIQVGYNKWQSENISGIDDVQSKREFSTVVSGKTKTKLTLHSEFIGASLAFEQTRRQKIEKSKDYKFDDDIFILALNSDDVSPDRYRPETNENFSTVNPITGLLNADTRYNTILSPVRNLLRWGNYWNGCLQNYQSSSVKFVSGEGNYDMVSDYNCSGTGLSCLAVSCDPLSEKGDISLSVYGPGLGYLHLPMLYTVEIINFSWDDYVMIRNNPTKAISVSQSETNLKRFFIKELTFEICKSKCKIVMWPYEDAPIRVIDTP